MGWETGRGWELRAGDWGALRFAYLYPYGVNDFGMQAKNKFMMGSTERLHVVNPPSPQPRPPAPSPFEWTN